MNLETIIPLLQLARAVAWGVVLIINLPAVWRILFSEPRGLDAVRCCLTLVGVANITFSTHWLASTSDTAWAAAYVMSIMGACGIAWVIGATERAIGHD